MDFIACATAHYTLVFLNAIGANGVIDSISNAYRSSYQLGYCMSTDSNYIQSCSDFTMVGYFVLITIVLPILARILVIFWNW